MKRRGSSFPLSQAQRFEHVFVRTPGTTQWTTRSMILNVETGALLEYAEKSGKKILKERYNIKNCEIAATDTNVTFDKELSMVLDLAEGKQLQLAFETQEAYDEWLEYFKSFSESFRLVTPEAPIAKPPPPDKPKPPAEKPPIETTSSSEDNKPAKQPRGSVRFEDGATRKPSQTAQTLQKSTSAPPQPPPPPAPSPPPPPQPAPVKAVVPKPIQAEPVEVIHNNPSIMKESARPMSGDAYEVSMSKTTSARNIAVDFSSSALNQSISMSEEYNETVEVDEVVIPPKPITPPVTMMKKTILFEPIDDSESTSQPHRKASLTITQDHPTIDPVRSPAFAVNVSPRFHSSSPFEHSHDQITELHKSSFSTGSSLLQSRSNDSVSEYTEESSSPAKTSPATVPSLPTPLKPEKPPSRRPSSQQPSPRDPQTGSDGQLSGRRLDRRPSLDKTAMQLLAADTSPLGEKRPTLERRPSLSQQLFGIEISPMSMKVDDRKSTSNSVENSTEKPPTGIRRPSLGSDVAKILMPELRDKLASASAKKAEMESAPSVEEVTGPKITSRMYSTPMEEGSMMDERRSSLIRLDVGAGSSMHHAQGQTTLSSEEFEDMIDESAIEDVAKVEAEAKKLPGKLKIQQPTSQNDDHPSYATGRTFVPNVAEPEPMPTPVLKKVPSMYKTAFNTDTASSELNGTIKATSSAASDRITSATGSAGIAGAADDSRSKASAVEATTNAKKVEDVSSNYDDQSHSSNATAGNVPTIGKIKLPGNTEPNNDGNPITSKGGVWKRPAPDGTEGSSNPMAAAAAKVAAMMAARNEASNPPPKSIEPPKPVVVAALTVPVIEKPAPISKPEPEENNSDDHLLIEVVGVIHPAHRLNRRVHIWNYSSGFSFDSIEDLHQFIYDIRDSGDAPLADLSYCTQDTFLDWSETMNALRDQEAKVMAEMYDDKVQLIINVTFMVGEEKITTQNFKINFSDSPVQIAAKIAEETGLDAKFLTKQINQELPKDNNFYQQGYVFLQNTMLFAEDLFLYQEEIIDRLSMQAEDLQEQLMETEEAAQVAVKVAEENSDKVMEFQEKQRLLEEMRLNDVRSKEEWELERDAFVARFQAEKTILTNDLRLLRQSTNPNTDRVFADLRRNEVLLGSLEDQLVKSEMANDHLKIQLQIASERIDRLEYDKQMIEKHHLDQMTGIQGAGEQVVHFNQKVYYSVDGGYSSSESKENKQQSGYDAPSPSNNSNRTNYFSKDALQNSSIKYYTPNTQPEKPVYNPRRSGGISSYFGDPHPYLTFSSDPADITQPRAPIATTSRLGALRSMEITQAIQSQGNQDYQHDQQQQQYHQQQLEVETQDHDNSTISNDDDQPLQHRKLSPVEMNRMLANRHLNGFVKNDNHPLRRALRQELPQLTRIHQLQREEERSKLTPYLISRSNSSHMTASDSRGPDAHATASDRYMDGTDSSNKKLKEVPENTKRARRPVAWKV